MLARCSICGVTEGSVMRCTSDYGHHWVIPESDWFAAYEPDDPLPGGITRNPQPSHDGDEWLRKEY